MEMNIEKVNLLDVFEDDVKALFKTDVITIVDLEKEQVHYKHQRTFILRDLLKGYLKEEYKDVGIGLENETDLAYGISYAGISRNIQKSMPYFKIFEIAMEQVILLLDQMYSADLIVEMSYDFVKFAKDGSLDRIIGSDFLFHRVQHAYEDFQEELNDDNLTNERKIHVESEMESCQKIQHDMIDFEFKKILFNSKLFSNNEVENLSMSDIDKITYFNRIYPYSNIREAGNAFEKYKEKLNLNLNNDLYREKVVNFLKSENGLILNLNLTSDIARVFKDEFIEFIERKADSIPVNCSISKNDKEFTIDFKTTSNNKKEEEIYAFKSFIEKIVETVENDRLGNYINEEITQWFINFKQELREINLISTFEDQNKEKEVNKRKKKL